MMDLDELQSVQSRERQTDSLQQLRETFYRDAGEYIEGLRAERERAAERADDPWNDPEISRLSDDIETAEGTVEAIYERRVGKIVKMASLAAADVPTEDGGLTEEERRLFDALVSAIERSRDRVEAILDGESPVPTGDDESPASMPEGGSPASMPDHAGANGVDHDHGSDPDPDPEQRRTVDADAPGDVDAASLMGEDPSDPSTGTGDETRDPPPEGALDAAPAPDSDASPERTADSDDRRASAEEHGREDRLDRAGADPMGAYPESDDGAGPDPESDDGPTGRTGAVTGREPHVDGDVDRSTVRITADVGEIYGVEGRPYDLQESDVVSLPEANVEPLVERGAAERLD